MIGKGNHREANQANFIGSAYWLANIMAFIATILLMPQLWRLLGGYIEVYLYQLYSEDMAEFAYLLVWLGSWAGVFFLLRMTFVTAFVAAAIGAAVRFV